MHGNLPLARDAEIVERQLSMIDLLGFSPVTPELLARRELLRRVDTKYLLDPAALARLLEALGPEYAILEAGGRRIASYRNLYFDTSELRCFHDHRRGRRLRKKVRIRHYPDRELSVLEIKLKKGVLITDKRRHVIAAGTETLDDRARDFLAEHAPELELVPQVRVDYQRIALVHRELEERLTIDLELAIGSGPSWRELPDTVVVEHKQPPGHAIDSPATRALAAFRPRSFSKYCAAVALLRPEVRHNLLRPQLRGLSVREKDAS